MHTLKEIQELLDLAPISHSKFEFLTFEIAQQLTTPRKMRFVLQKIVETDRLFKKNQQHLKTAKNVNAGISAEDISQCEKESAVQKELLDHCYEWLDQFSKEQVVTHLTQLSSSDADYWVTKIGMQAAIDILTDGKMSPDTMQKMIMFEKKEFSKAVIFATELARKIQQNIADVEAKLNGEQ